MSTSRPDVRELLVKVHSTVLEPGRWAEVIDEVSLLLEADSAMLFSVPTRSPEPFWNISRNIDPEMLQAYAQSFVANDVWLIGAQQQQRYAAGVVSLGEQLVERSTFLSSLYYNEFLANYRHDRMVNVCLRGPRATGFPPETGICFYRERGKEAFHPSQVELLNYLAPHFVLAIRNLWHARALSVRTATQTHALDQVSVPVYAIAARGRLAYANRAAERGLADRRWLMSEGGYLKASRPVREQGAASKAIRRLAAGIASTVLLTDGAGAQAILVTAPLTTNGELAVAERAIGLAWIVSLSSDRAPIDQLSRLFLLTSAEERLIRRLVMGDDLTAAADDLGVTLNTARSQLKSIFGKTGRRTQGALLALVQRMRLIGPPSGALGS